MNAADIKELRLIGEWLIQASPFAEDSDGDRVIAAADEIDRLRKENAELIDQLKMAMMTPEEVTEWLKDFKLVRENEDG